MLLCVDVGSTFTKAALVDGDTGELLATAEHPRPPSSTDVLDGVDACRAALLADHPEASSAEVLACSSAGGGLRIAVVGNEELVTAEAGRRVALSSGGKVVAVLGRTSPDSAFGELDTTTRPDVVLLTGGTDDGDEEGILDGARRLAVSGWQGPVVVAGNVAARDAVGEVLAGWPVVVTDNVVPRIGVLAPEPARRAIREMFLAHVIGGKGLSSRADFTAMVQGATPDLVLTGVEVLARVAESDVVVVDIGGATTDVHSVVRLDPEDAGLSREVVATTPVTRTVEGDLGMRWSAVTTWEAGHEAGLLDDDSAPAVRRNADPSFLPTTDVEHREDELIASAAATLALRRHVGSLARRRGSRRPGRRAHRQGPARGRAARRFGRRTASLGPGVGVAHPRWAGRYLARGVAAARASTSRRRPRLRARRSRPALGAASASGGGAGT